MAKESKLGMAVKEFVENNNPVPSTLVNKIVVDRLTQLDASTSGWVLHGFPWSRDQADVSRILKHRLETLNSKLFSNKYSKTGMIITS